MIKKHFAAGACLGLAVSLLAGGACAESIEGKYLNNVRQVTSRLRQSRRRILLAGRQDDHLSGRAAGLPVLSDL